MESQIIFDAMNIYFMENYYEHNDKYCPYKIYTLDEFHRKYIYSEIFCIIGLTKFLSVTFLEILVKQQNSYLLLSICPWASSPIKKIYYNSTTLITAKLKICKPIYKKTSYIINKPIELGPVYTDNNS